MWSKRIHTTSELDKPLKRIMITIVLLRSVSHVIERFFLHSIWFWVCSPWEKKDLCISDDASSLPPIGYTTLSCASIPWCLTRATKTYFLLRWYTVPKKIRIELWKNYLLYFIHLRGVSHFRDEGATFINLHTDHTGSDSRLVAKFNSFSISVCRDALQLSKASHLDFSVHRL